MPAREWLRQHGYDDIADLIDEVMGEWRAAGKKTRRNWWKVLAGGKNGRQRTQCGRVFPVLRAAQIREGKEVTENALWRGEDDSSVPGHWEHNRWRKAVDIERLEDSDEGGIR